MTIRKRIGARVRQLRKRAGYRTQEALAKAAGLSDGAIGYIERGETAPATDNLKPLADALGCEVADIYAFVESKHSRPAHIQEIHARILDSLKGFNEQQLLFFADIAEAAHQRLNTGKKKS